MCLHFGLRKDRTIGWGSLFVEFEGEALCAPIGHVQIGRCISHERLKQTRELFPGTMITQFSTSAMGKTWGIW
jgi:hypothetical protein